ncbi:MAG: T9SS type A sorting domain-containing protein [Bacteroidales bacterium]|nr:T9SS type A sorting domain-containing protein [Bacteroidales bacterium]
MKKAAIILLLVLPSFLICHSKVGSEPVIRGISSDAASEIVIDSVITSNPSCSGDNNGSITIIASGENKPFQYSINGTDYQSDSTFNNIPAGAYHIYVKDAGDIEISGPEITIENPPVLSLSSFDINNLFCNGDNSGAMIIRARGGTPPYRYSLGNSFSEDSVFTGLAAGNYNVTIVDDNGCELIQTGIEITEPPVLSVTETEKNDLECYGDNSGSVFIRADGGLKPYEYAVEGFYQSDSLFTGLEAGPYTVTILDENGCAAIGPTVTLTQPEPILTTVAEKSDVLCVGDSNGSFKVRASNGTAPYIYSIDGGNSYQDDSVFSQLVPGTYKILTKDAEGCKMAGPGIQIEEPDSIALDFDIEDALCYGDSSGNITVVASEGTPPYSYSLDSETYQVDSVFNTLTAGTYDIYVRDSNDCPAETTGVPVSQPTELVVSGIETNGALCYGDSSGSLNIEAGGGTRPYRYSVDGINFQSDSSFMNISGGRYQVHLLDSNQCENEPAFAEISEPDSLTVNVTCTEHIFSDSPGEIVAEASGGTAPYLYTLMPGGTEQDNGVFIFETPEEAGTYTVEVNDYYGCGPVSTENIDIIDSTFNAVLNLYAGKVKIYPNPSSGVVTIEFGTDKPEMKLELISIDGRKVYTQKLINTNGSVHEILDLAGIRKGFYFIRIDGLTMKGGLILR